MGCGFGERIRPSGLLQGLLQKVLQQRWYFAEPLVARRRSVGKPLGLPCGAYAKGTTRGANAWAEPKKKSPGTEKVLVGTRLLS